MYRSLYPSLDEIVVVDDGSEEAAEGPARIIRLPRKDIAKNPCVPINIGVRAARNPVIVLTNPEIQHEGPILPAMRAALDELGPRGYVAAACRDGSRWYCHSSQTRKDHRQMGRAPIPEGAGLHFCAMFHRGLFEAAGGFDEAYRDGGGYEDNDFLWSLHAAGARVRILDDCVTTHQTTRTRWSGGHPRNMTIFYQKWLNVR